VGDVLSLYTTGALGALAGLGLTADADDEEAMAAATTAGFLAGLYAGDRLAGRRFDFTAAEGRLLGLGAAAGGLMGLGVAAAGQTDGATLPLLVTSLAGALGAATTVSLMAPARDGRRLGAAVPNVRGPERRHARLELSPASVPLLAAGRPGLYPLGRLTF
jgi:hypothetical protein